MRRLILILILIALVAGGMWSWYSYRSKKGSQKPVGYTGPKPAFKVTASVTEEVAEKLKKVEPPKPLSDPFAIKVNVKKKIVEKRPESGPAEPKAEVSLRLQGVWIDSGMKIAFINDQSLQIGDTVSGWKVAAIYKSSVVVKRGSRSKTLKVEE